MFIRYNIFIKIKVMFTIEKEDFLLLDIARKVNK